MYHITFNLVKSILLLVCYNVDPSLLGQIYLIIKCVSVVSHDRHLGSYISTDIHDRNILANVCDLYYGSNSVIADFHACDSEVLEVYSQHSVCISLQSCIGVNSGI